MSDTPRLFICYGPEDSEFVEWLSESLRVLGHNIWLDRQEIRGGLSTVEAMQSALDKSDVMLLVISPEAMRSRLVNSQWTYFYHEREKKLIPLMLRPLTAPDTLNFLLASLQSIDFSRGYRRGVNAYEAALRALHTALLETYNALAQPTAEALTDSFRTPVVTDDQLPTRQAGLLRVHDGMPVETYLGWVKRARRQIRVMNTWTGIFHNHIDLLYAPVENGCSVQILLLNPSSPFARQRSLDIHPGNGSGSPPDADEVPRNIQTSIRQLAALAPDLSGEAGTLELRLYDVLPSFSIHHCDSRTLMGFYPHFARTTTFPILEVETDSIFGKRLHDEFDAIWTHATPIDLTPGVSPRVNDANDSLDEPLSARELEILTLIHAGLSNQEIAEKLFVTVATIKKHIQPLWQTRRDQPDAGDPPCAAVEPHYRRVVGTMPALSASNHRNATII